MLPLALQGVRVVLTKCVREVVLPIVIATMARPTMLRADRATVADAVAALAQRSSLIRSDNSKLVRAWQRRANTMETATVSASPFFVATVGLSCAKVVAGGTTTAGFVAASADSAGGNEEDK